MQPVRRSLRVFGALAAIGLLGGLTLGNAMPAAATQSRGADPQSGPHARDEGRHAHLALHFSPARTHILPRRERTVSAGLAFAQRAAGVDEPLTVTPAPLMTEGPITVRPATLSPAGGVMREVFGFAPYWALGGSANWDYSLLTTLAYFGLDINADGSINSTTPGWTGWNSQDLVNTINRAHLAGDRVVVVIKAFDEATINAIVTSPSVTQTTITNAINAIASKNLDGVNVDFEGFSSPSFPNIQSGVTNFATQLSAQVHQRWPDAMVSVDTYTGSASWDGGIFKIGALAPVVDALFVMAYDMSFSNTPGHLSPNAPLNGWTYNDTTAVAQYLTKAPASKVILGVPYYGYKGSTPNNQPYAPATGIMANTYAGILDDFACAQVTRNWDATGQSPWAYWFSPATADPCGANHNSWRELYYDDASSLALKYDLVNGNGLLGTGMWALGYDGVSQDLWRVLGQKFGTAWPGQFQGLAPARILDTRNGTGGFVGALSPGQSIDVPVVGRGGVPFSGVAGVVLNVTATQPSAASYLTVYPTGAQRPLASNLNFGAGQTVANLVPVALGKGGKVTVFNAFGAAHVIFDVYGLTTAQVATSGSIGQFRPLVPARILDTRNGTGGFSAPLSGRQTIDLPVAGQGGVPATGAAAVVLNLTVTNPTAASYLTAFPSGTRLPPSSNLNFAAGQTIANRVMVRLGTTGSVSIFNAFGNADVVVDVSGWFSDGSDAVAGGQFTGLVPARVLDTRTGVGGISGAVGPGQSVLVSIAGQGGIPTMGSGLHPTAVAFNLTATKPTAGGHLTAYPSGMALPVASDVNFAAGMTVPNLTVVKLGADGAIAVFNFAGRTDVVIDVVGWYN